MPGIPLLFTDSGSPADTIYTPLPGLFLSDDLYLGDDVFLDDGPTAYALWTNVSTNVAAGVTTTVTPTPAEAFMPVPAGITPSGDIIQPVTPEPALAIMPVPNTTGQDLVVSYTTGEPAVAFMPVPQTSGGMQVIIIPSVRELPPLRLYVSVETPGGRRFRWGEDEPDPTNVPASLRFSDTVPGGFENQDCTLPRKPNVDYSDLERLSNITVAGAGGQIAWEGRLERAPRTSGDEMSVSPSAVGHQAHLDDNKAVQEVYVDSDLSNWGPPTAGRSLALNTSNFSVESVEVVGGVGVTNEPALKLSTSDAWSAPFKKISQATYEFPDASSGFGFLHFWSLLSQAGGPWVHDFYTDSDGNLGAPTAQSSNYGGADTIAYWNPTVRGNQYVNIEWYYNATPAGQDGAQFTNHLRRLRVFGNTGLSLRTTGPGDPGGYYASDIIYHAVSKYAPALNVSYGNSSSSIRQSQFVITHAAYKDMTTVSEIVRQTARFGLEDWGVWDNRTFHFGERGTLGRAWRARSGPTKLEETGPQVERLFESVVVQYQDVDGTTRTVGPPGSRADYEDASLKDNDPDNPANRAGIIRRALLTMGTSAYDPSSGRPNAPVNIGRRFLEEQKLLDSSGRATIVGHVESDRGVLFPYWAVRAGDTITFTDAASATPRRIVRTDKDHSARTCSIDLDAPPEGLQALLERLGVGLTDLGFS